MKVIARSSETEILVSMEDAELAMITGHDRLDAPGLKAVTTTHQDNYGRYYNRFRLGAVVDVSKIFTHYHSILKRREQIIAAQETLRAAASILNPAKDFFKEATQEMEPKHD